MMSRGGDFDFDCGAAIEPPTAEKEGPADRTGSLGDSDKRQGDFCHRRNGLIIIRMQHRECDTARRRCQRYIIGENSTRTFRERRLPSTAQKYTRDTLSHRYSDHGHNYGRYHRPWNFRPRYGVNYEVVRGTLSTYVKKKITERDYFFDLTATLRMYEYAKSAKLKIS